ncbi:MAG: MATE family efflux transporter, partial [Planctomycetota bacterium]|nr:MATE family efflux transporter [Planctomycetota bacterium]
MTTFPNQEPTSDDKAVEESIERPVDPPFRSTLIDDPIRPTLFRLALPVLLEQLLVFCVGFFDTYLSGRIDSLSTVAIGIAAYVSWLAAIMFSLVGTGTGAIVARHWGAGEFDAARRLTHQALLLSLVAGLLGWIFIFFGIDLLLPLLKIRGREAEIVSHYMRIDACGYIGTAISLVAAASLRAVGDTRTPMWILGLVNVLNMIFSPAFVFGIGPWPVLGLDGIVAGTVLARLTGGVLMLVALKRGVSGLKLTPPWLRFDRVDIRRILRIGIPAGIDGMIMWLGHFLFLMIIARLAKGDMNSAVFAAHVVGIQIEAISYLPASAWGHASATLIGQALGAARIERARTIAHEAVRQCGVMALCLTVVFFVAAKPLYDFMHHDAAVSEAGTPAFRMLAFFQLPLVAGIIYVFSLRGAGQTRAPLWI